MKRTLLLLAIITLFFSCKNSSEVTLNHTNINGLVAKKGHFEFVFDEDIYPDSLTGVWLKEDFINFNPEIEGEYKWTEANTLIFLPKHQLNPATKYSATISNKVLKYIKNKKLNIENIEFFTQNLELNSTSIFWTKKDNKDIVRLNLDFNEKVNVSDLKKYLKISSDDKDIKFNITKQEESDLIVIDLPEIKKSDDDLIFDIIIKEGLKPIGGNIATEIEVLKHGLLNSPYTLVINDVEINHDGTEGTLNIICTQKVKLKDIKKFISISPKVKYTVEQTDRGFLIKSSKFSASDKYTLKIKAGLLGEVGGKLKSSYSREITFGKLKPAIKFEKEKAFYLSALGNKNIEAKIINVEKVKIIISKIYENNLLAERNSNNFFNTNQNYYDYYDDYYDDYYYNDYYSSNAIAKDIIFEKTYETSKMPKLGSVRLLKFDFTDKIKDYDGIYHIEIRSENDRWLNDSRYVSLSDIGIIAKNGKDYLTVFLNSIKTAKTIANASIKVFGSNNQLAGEGKTDAEGFVRINLKNQDISGFAPSLITATKANGDYNILMFRDTKVKTSDFELTGIRIPKNGLQTFVYPERDLYRPGEKVNFAVIIRENEWQIPGKLPIKVEVRTPNGKILKTIKKTLSSQGSFDSYFETEKANQTGNYIINVISSNGIFLASKSIQVEEFMPDRIRVTASLDKEMYEIGDEATVNINANNLFGTPAANRNYEIEVNYSRAYINPKGLEEYSFYLNNRDDDFDSDVFEGKTDKNGNVVENFMIPTDYENMGKLTATVYSTVFDETNRPVNRKNVAQISTQKAYYGIGYFDYYVGTNQQIEIPIVAVDKNEKITSTKANIKIIKHEYKTILNKSGSYYTYNSQRVEKIISEKTINLSSKQNFSFNPKFSGRYEIRISSPDAENNYVSNSFYAYSWGTTNNNSFEVNNEGKINIQFDKEIYDKGENATILFKAPFDGKLLVTVERDNVLEHFYLQTNNRAVEFQLMTTDRFLPNIFITATLFKEHKKTDFPLTVAHGFKVMKVREKNRKIDLEIIAEKESRSRTKQIIKVKSKPNSKITIAVVDEGILQISRFKTPNPYEYFYQNRALLVNSYNIYPFLFKEISANNARAGGGDFDLGKRVNPMENNRVKLVSFWSGIVETDSRGNTSFEIDIPQFSGSLRVMVVAHKGNSFGSAEENIIVADPIIMSSSIPRFLSPGDTAIITTTLTNTTKKPANAKAKIECSGPLKILSQTSKSASINSKGEAQVIFKVYAKKEIGQGKISISCKALGEKFLEETEISIRPAISLVKETGAGTISAGNSKAINLSRPNFITSSQDYKLVLSKNPMTEFADQLNYLVRYPFGCSEQTVSAAFPQLYFAEITKALYKDDSQAENINNNIKAAITKLQMRQIYNGGITMWDNGSKPSWWITAFAAHFSIEAKKAGYNVDQTFINKMLSYLQNRLKSKETVNYSYNRGSSKKIAPKSVAYSLYVLALADKSDISLMNYYKSKTEILSLDAKYLLSAAYALSGDKEKAKELLPTAFTGEISDKQFGGDFYSPIRDEAIALNALLDIDPKNNQIGTMAMHLSKELREKRYLNTQEKVFSLLALGKIAKKANESTITASIKSNGNKLANYSEGISTFTTAQIKNGEISIDVKGTGSLYYFWETEGITKDGTFKEIDNYLKVRKTFYDRHGNIISENKFKANDLIIIKLSISTSYNKSVENVAITDMLPACFEIENSRTDEIPGTEWIKNQTRPDFLDIRDDRINIFDDIHTYRSGKTQDYYYVVRAVSKGTYQMGPVSADAMYNGEYHSYNGGGIIIVE